MATASGHHGSTQEGNARPRASGEDGDSYDVKPYSIHVSSKYLDLTRQKLELTRLPREVSKPGSSDGWEPKAEVEPLIDFWLERYSWRHQEEHLNETIPQFRTAIPIPKFDTSVRLHFTHVRSPHANAIPLLLLPPFPLSGLSLAHLTKLFTEPTDTADGQAFHLVIPSLPGLGFSDALPTNVNVVSTTAKVLDILMTERLSYPFYLVSNSVPASTSPAEVDWELTNELATNHSATCIGAHFISPPLEPPRPRKDPWEWAKWTIAKFLKAPILGYKNEDFSALSNATSRRSQGHAKHPYDLGLGRRAVVEPNALAYALCDSPTGLLVFLLKRLQSQGRETEFTQTDVLNWAMLAWLPGPEAGLRFWASCASASATASPVMGTGSIHRPKVAITVFLGTREEDQSRRRGESEPPANPAHIPYTCPGWANSRYQVVHINRADRAPKLVAWQRPELIVAGLTGLAKKLSATDHRLKARSQSEASAPLEIVVVDEQAHSSEGVGLPSSDQRQASPSPSPAALGSPSGEMRKNIGLDSETPDTLVVTPDSSMARNG